MSDVNKFSEYLEDAQKGLLDAVLDDFRSFLEALWTP